MTNLKFEYLKKINNRAHKGQLYHVELPEFNRNGPELLDKENNGVTYHRPSFKFNKFVQSSKTQQEPGKKG
jgi:hypothetical protein